VKINLKKQPEKYLKAVDANTRTKLEKAIYGLTELEGDIVKIDGTDLYRLKIHHYRIAFRVDRKAKIIDVEMIGARGDFYKHIRR
jgi:mRNA-degrading endonuclease RelE of RelBE toxin-antitoxin system